MIPERFVRFDALCGELSCERPGPLLALHPLAPGLFPALRQAVLGFLWPSAPPGVSAGDEAALLAAFVERGAELPWVTGSGRVLPTRATAVEYAALVRAVGAILESTGVTPRLEEIHLFSVKLKGGASATAEAPGLAEVKNPHLETWQGATVSTVAFHLAVLGDLANNFIQFYSSPAELDEAWLRSVPDAAGARALAQRHQPLGRAPRPGELVIFDAGTMHHTRQRSPSGPRVTLEIMATLPGPTTRVDHRAWDEALPVERFLGIGRDTVMIPDEPVGKTVRVGTWVEV